MNKTEWLRQIVSGATHEAYIAYGNAMHAPLPDGLTLEDAAFVARQIEKVYNTLTNFGKKMSILDEQWQDNEKYGYGIRPAQVIDHGRD